MRDPLEGIGRDGSIVTGAALDRVPPVFASLLDDAAESVRRAAPNASLYVYGSVATGRARPGSSDLDLLTVGLPAGDATDIERVMSDRYPALVRSVEIAPMQPEDLVGGDDERYGNRVYVRHYCAHVRGPDPTGEMPRFPADARAARGFNGDIAEHLARWRRAVAEHPAPQLGRRIARKTLSTVASLVSIHDHVWTTDRDAAAVRWSEISPELTGPLATLSQWSEQWPGADIEGPGPIREMLDDAVGPIAISFTDMIGLWSH